MAEDRVTEERLDRAIQKAEELAHELGNLSLALKHYPSAQVAAHLAHQTVRACHGSLELARNLFKLELKI